MGKNKNSTQILPRRGISMAGWIAAIIAIHVILGLVYWHATPFGGAPDESAHGSYLQTLMTSHAFPKYDPANAEGYEFYQPPLYYIAAAPFYLIGKLAGMETPQEAARLLSIILGALSIYFIFKTLRRLLPSDATTALLCAGFVALLPTHVMMSSTVSNDILMELVFNAGLCVIAGMIMEGVSWRSSIILGIILGAGILTKMTCLALLPIAALAYFLIGRAGKIDTKGGFAQFAGAVLTALLISGWWLVRNYVLYKDPIALSQMQQSFTLHSPNPVDWFRQGMPAATYLGMVVSWTFRSFWGVFGYMNIFMPAWLYILLAVISAFVLIGAWRGSRDSRVEPDMRAIFLFTIALVAVAFLKLNATVFQAQGRYLYPALLPISYLWVSGILTLSRDNHKLACIIMAAVAVLVQTVALLTIL